MFGALFAKIAAGIALAAVLACGVLGFLYRGEVRDNAVLRAANKTNLDTIARMESDIIINEAKAIADALERREQEKDSDERNRAIDAAVENGCSDPAFDALLERRRMQRERDREKAGRP